MAGAQRALGLDFGTSNSAVASLAADGSAVLLPLEGEARTLPSAIFFAEQDGHPSFGRAAMGLYLQGAEGRLMRALKSLLGSPLFQERTAVGGRQLGFDAIVARFLQELRERAERQLGEACRRVVIGRPVHFVDDSRERDAQAERDLRLAATAAGFEDIAFELEPIAAAMDYERRLDRESLVLVADIGGGTSDFTLVRLGPERAGAVDRTPDVLATTGVHIGGTDYDRKLSLARVMPLLGFRHHGPQGREVPSGVFFDLATWHLINWLYTPKALRDAAGLRTSYADPRLHARLMEVLAERLGHQLCNAVEMAKIESASGAASAAIDLDLVEAGLQVELQARDLATELAGLFDQVVKSASECVRRAQAPRPDAIYLTGGSAALQPFQQALSAAFPGVPLVQGDLFGGVAAGLGYCASLRF